MVVGDADQCFVPGTLVTMADRTTRPIEQVVEGDQVLSNYGNGDFRPARVLRVHRSQTAAGTTITLASGRALTSTPEHTHFAGHLAGFGASGGRQSDAIAPRNEPGDADGVVATLAPTRRMVVTLCDEQRGARAFHRVELFGSDEEGRSALENELGLFIRPERRDTNWRFENASSDMAEIVATVEQIQAVIDVDVQYTARLANRRGAGATNTDLPFTAAAARGAGHGDGQRERRVRTGRVGGAGRARHRGLRPGHRADPQLRRRRDRHPQLGVRVPRRGLPQPPAVRGDVPGRVGDRAGPELPVDPAHPRRRERGDRQQRGPPAQAPLDRADRRRADRPLPRRGRARRGPVRRARDRPARRTRKACASATPRSSTGRTRRAASSRRRWSAPGSRTGSSAAPSSTTGAR